MSARSFLYVRGDQPDRIAKAPSRGADALILDLEDGVAPANKDEARSIVGDAVGTLDAEVWVRVNPGARMSGDVASVVRAGLDGIVLAKASPDSVAALDDILFSAEERAGLPAASVAVVPLIEDARAVQAMDDIARGSRVVHIALGEADLSSELGMTWTDVNLAPIRVAAIVASVAAGIGAPTAPVSTEFKDLDALRTSTEYLRDMGFGARAAIHPAQIDVINDVFTPTAEAIARARDVLARFEAADGGATTDADGKMIDEAIVRAARRVVDLAARG